MEEQKVSEIDASLDVKDKDAVTEAKPSGEVTESTENSSGDNDTTDQPKIGIDVETGSETTGNNIEQRENTETVDESITKPEQQGELSASTGSKEEKDKSNAEKNPAENEEVKSQKPTENQEVKNQKPTENEEVKCQEPTENEEVKSQEPTENEEVKSQQPTENEEVKNQEPTNEPMQVDEENPVADKSKDEDVEKEDKVTKLAVESTKTEKISDEILNNKAGDDAKPSDEETPSTITVEMKDDSVEDDEKLSAEENPNTKTDEMEVDNVEENAKPEAEKPDNEKVIDAETINESEIKKIEEDKSSGVEEKMDVDSSSVTKDTEEEVSTVEESNKAEPVSEANSTKEDSPPTEDSAKPAETKSFANEFERFLHQPSTMSAVSDNESKSVDESKTQGQTEVKTTQNFNTIMSEETSNSSWYKMPENKEDTMDVAKMGLLGDDNSNMSMPENGSVVSSNIGENSLLSFPADEGSNLSVPDDAASIQQFSGHQPVFDESANMNPPSNITFAQPGTPSSVNADTAQPGTPSSVNADTTMSESTTPTAKRFRRGTLQQAVVEANEQGHNITAADIFEYQWPQETDADWYILQEQLSVYLDVKSFKRKYPDIFRRVCDKLEKDFLRDKGVVTETQSDLGLTALKSDDVHELMGRDYPAKYKEFLKILHEREKKRIAEKLKEYDAPRLEKEKMIEYTKKAMKSASDWNKKMLKERNKQRRAYFDMQTFTVHYPKNKKFKIQPTIPSVKTAYPITLIPGQFQEYYKTYTPEQLKHFPLNTTVFNAAPKKADPIAKLQEQIQKRQKQQLALQQRVVVQKNIVEEMENSQQATENTPDKEIPSMGSDEDTNMAIDKPEDKPLDRIKKKEKSSSREASAEKVLPFHPLLVRKDPGECRICKEDKDENKIPINEELISCSECNRAGHPSCLDLTDEMVKVIKTYPWQCMECKTCVLCMDPYDEDKMLFCDNCDRGYHTFCVGLKSLPTGRWECRSCTGDTTPIIPLPRPPPKAKRGRKPKDPNAQPTPAKTLKEKEKESSIKATPVRLTARRVAMEAKKTEKENAEQENKG